MRNQIEPLDYETPQQRSPLRTPVSGRRLFFALGMAISFAAFGYGVGTHERELVSFWACVGGGLIGLSVPLRDA